MKINLIFAEHKTDMQTRLKEGDIFYVEYNQKYFFGKLLMDVAQRMSERTIPMKEYHDCYLVAIYKGIYDEPVLTETEFIIPSIYTQFKQFYQRQYKTEWHFYKNEPIDYTTDISFPECITIAGKSGICFRCGEIQIPLELTNEQWRTEFDIQRKIHFQYSTILMYACHYQDREDLLEWKPYTYLKKEDLRYAPQQREEVYRQIGANIGTSYSELAAKHGVDLGRWYIE